jgi:formate dehydrogenase alpha subunit
MACTRFGAVWDGNKCLFCHKNQRCELQHAATVIKVQPMTDSPYNYPGLEVQPGGPLFERDYNLCIVCGRCVRVCEEVRGRTALAFTYRNGRPAVDSRLGLPMEQTDCEFCGACVDACPTGALMEKHHKRGLASGTVTSTCPYCGVGCQLRLEYREGELLRTFPDPDGPANRGQACVKGRFGITQMVHHPDRLTTPLIRDNGHLRPATWEEALDRVASRLKGYQGREVGVMGSPKATNEAGYLLQKWTRSVLGSGNLDQSERQCHTSSLNGLMQSTGSGAMTTSIADIGRASVILVAGSNLRAAHPVIGLQVVGAARRGAKVILINPRYTDLNSYADTWLRPRPGTDVALLMGLARAIVDADLWDHTFVDDRCDGFEQFRDSLSAFPLEEVDRLTGVPRSDMEAAARTLATAGPAAILFSSGITQSSHGTDSVLALANLALLTGNIGKDGAGLCPLRGHNNSQGASDMGLLPDFLPGYSPVADEGARSRFEAAWGTPVPPTGLDSAGMVEAAARGDLKSLFVMGENPAMTLADSDRVRQALGKLEFLVVQDMFLTETARMASVVLPACSSAEGEGTFTNTERRVQLVRRAISPAGASRPDWLIVSQLARRMGGQGFDHQHPAQVWDEVAGLVPDYVGISHRRLEDGGLQWPCPSAAHPGISSLHTDAFLRGKAQFTRLEYRPPAEPPDAEYPLVLTTECSLFQFQTGSMTRKVEGLEGLRGEEAVEINLVDAQGLGIGDGDWVRVSSSRGSVEVRARVTGASPPGMVSMTHHFAEVPTNSITCPALDPVSGVAEFKATAVKIEKAHA